VVLPCGSTLLFLGKMRRVAMDNPSITSSLDMPLRAPLNPTHQYAGFGLGVGTGVGYNIARHNAFVGEFMWNWLFASDAALQPIKIVLQSPDINGHRQPLEAYSGRYAHPL